MVRFDLPVRLSDYVWLGVAVLVALLALAGLYSWARDAVRSEYALGELFWVFLGLGALLGSAGLLVALAWRRTCWGALVGSPRERREQAAGE